MTKSLFDLGLSGGWESGEVKSRKQRHWGYYIRSLQAVDRLGGDYYSLKKRLMINLRIYKEPRWMKNTRSIIWRDIRYPDVNR